MEILKFMKVYGDNENKGYLYLTRKSKDYERKMKAMSEKSFDYKFKHNWSFLDGYTGANFDRAHSLDDYRENLHRAFNRVGKFNKLSKKKQQDILNNPYSGGNYHITFDMGYIQFYKDTHKH